MRKSTDFIVIHCSATPAGMDIGAKEIDRWHRAKGWFRIGYHFVIRRDGSIEYGRELNAVGAHAVGFNERSIGICLVGGVAKDNKTPENNYTPAQWLTLEKLVSELEQQFPKAKVVGHRDLNPGRGCPSFNVKDWQERRKALGNGRGESLKEQKPYKPLVYSVLKEGSKGPLVKTLQAKLSCFYQIQVDGVFGPETTKVVRAFQQRERLIDDGIVGPRTWSALLRYD